MNCVINRQLDDQFAKAWYNLGGDFSYMFSKKVLAYCKRNAFAPKNVLDVYCGAGNFLAEMQKAGIKCVGTEGSAAFVKFNQENHAGMEFLHTPALNVFNTKEKFDLITCIYDLVNFMETYQEWQLFFASVYKQLNKGGKFMFDYNTLKRLKNWDTVVFEQSNDMDYVQSVKPNVYDKTVINYVYYIKNSNNKYHKTSAIYTETSFETSKVLEALKKAGFKNVEICDFNLNPATNPELRNKVHIIATK